MLYRAGVMVLIGSDNGLLPVRHQAIVWDISDLLTFGPLTWVKFDQNNDIFV